MKILNVYNRGGTLSAEWKLFKGGYFAVNWRAFRILQRFFVTGIPTLGTEKEFIFRFSVELDSEPKFSFLTLELFNNFEGRIFYLWVKLWKNYTIDLAFNFGFRVTKESRLFLARMRQESELERLRELKKLQNKGGGNRQWPRAVQVR